MIASPHEIILIEFLLCPRTCSMCSKNLKILETLIMPPRILLSNRDVSLRNLKVNNLHLEESKNIQTWGNKYLSFENFLFLCTFFFRLLVKKKTILNAQSLKISTVNPYILPRYITKSLVKPHGVLTLIGTKTGFFKTGLKLFFF